MHSASVSTYIVICCPIRKLRLMSYLMCLHMDCREKSSIFAAFGIIRILRRKWPIRSSGNSWRGWFIFGEPNMLILETKRVIEDRFFHTVLRARGRFQRPFLIYSLQGQRVINSWKSRLYIPKIGGFWSCVWLPLGGFKPATLWVTHEIIVSKTVPQCLHSIPRFS